MTLRTKCILAPRSQKDGTRISVMSRHTLNDGVTPHPEITEANFDEWQKGLAPPEKLVGKYYRGDVQWSQFEDGYINFLEEPTQQDLIRALISCAMEENVTIMCVEEIPEHCHRKILAEECKRIEPRLTIWVR